MTLLRQPLFNSRLLLKKLPLAPTPPRHKQILHDWAAAIRDGSLAKQGEVKARAPFLRNLFHEILGYQPFGGNTLSWSIDDEASLGPGAADAALGEFSKTGVPRIVAPMELKGADTRDLDAIMPGRHKSPVQQAWEYAMDTPGCRFVVLSNMVEIRLYAVGHTRQAYETWNLLDVADKDSEYQRLRLLLGAENLLSGTTANLLLESQDADKEITRRLYADYKTWRINLIVALAQANGLPFRDILRHAQTILDRILFIAFAEDRGLLPSHTLSECYSHRNPYQPQPVWQNFQGLFRAIDKGNPALRIPAYNGGLFAPDPELDALRVPDDACAMFKELGEYDFASEVGVTVLGHIFEQSIEDLEKLRQLAETDNFTLQAISAEARESSRSVSGKRKEHGIVYTPDAITSFIVEQTLGSYLEDRRKAMIATWLDLKQPTDAEGNFRWRKLTEADRGRIPEKRGRGKAKVERDVDLAPFLFWHDWREALTKIRVVDPACGSGAFLIAAFDVLDAEYRHVNEQIQAITGNPDFFEIDRSILNNNLYGVDLNAESIEITKLSLWLKTAQHGKPLESLEAHLRVGNSLISPADHGSEYCNLPFDWTAAFPEVVANGGFDVVLGNPPYVRMERLKPIKPYLEQRYAVASDRLDLYGYFYELGVRLLKSGGRLGYISSSTFFKTGSGDKLRHYLLTNAWIRALVDFGDIQVFEGVTTYPAIVVLERASIPDPAAPVRFLALGDTMPENLSAAFAQAGSSMPQDRLGRDGWRLEDDRAARLRDKLTQGHSTLKEVYGSPLYGIKTGLNEAFVVDRATRDRLIAADPKSAELLKPFLEGKDLKKWRIEPQELWLIYIPKNAIDIDNYAAIKAHLLPFRDKLEKRATQQAWFELQQAQAAYIPAFEAAKIFYPDMSQGSKFSLDEQNFYVGNTAYFIPKSDWFLLGLLNSSIIWHLLVGKADALRGGEWRLRLFAENIETLPAPTANDAQGGKIAHLAEDCQRCAEARRDAQAVFRRRIADLAPGGATAKLSTKLGEWWRLDDFKSFQTEVKARFKRDIPLAERNDWEDWFARQKAAVEALNARLTALEAQLNRAVYVLFNLDERDIALLEGATLAPASAPCDDSAHDSPPTSRDRAAPQPMARPPRGRGQPAGRLSAPDTRLHAELDGTGKRGRRSATTADAAESTRPLEATRTLDTAAGALSYGEIAERLAINLAHCLDEIFTGDPDGIAITPEWICDLHRRVAGELFPDWAGRFRATDVQVGTHQPPSAFEVPVQIRNFCLDLTERLSHLSNAESIAELLAWVDWRFQCIHPFKDFNGRVGRMLLLALSFKLNLPPIDPAAGEEKAAYFAALRDADAGHHASLQALWLNRLSHSSS